VTLSHPPNRPSIDTYLDGLLSPEDQTRAERALRENPRARAAVDMQRRIDESLVRMFQPPAEAAPLRMPAARRFPARTVFWAAAAAIVLAGVGVFTLLQRTGGTGPSPLAPLYRSTIAAGFVPQEICTSSDKFADWCEYAYGQYLYPPEKHDGIEFVGWNYANVVTMKSGVLLARVQGREVLVVIDRKYRDEHPIKDSGDPTLHSFRKEVGKVVLYEVTPLDKPSIIPILATTPPGK
jgi:hypothetical protein